MVIWESPETGSNVTTDAVVSRSKAVGWGSPQPKAVAPTKLATSTRKQWVARRMWSLRRPLDA